ncbi:hypothetical protein M409DRAFT_50107 [Zasmidium cellare ATCC 36951]|uniref:Uncharacterized protein n=1 Tax=Zasmidium cellare ATCC 36951 TaxID=1080233 RepID=A0A6A6D063_ZASCE|nr:uncharacterized protein M409DRAFT_50107 [Zasmidium cellare ATCC 36951]KAF2172403.1 hypothetical protein M409DRAFT_50107 [Zasmidium cellare ATCC 36951]
MPPAGLYMRVAHSLAANPQDIVEDAPMSNGPTSTLGEDTATAASSTANFCRRGKAWIPDFTLVEWASATASFETRIHHHFQSPDRRSCKGRRGIERQVPD